MSKSNHQSSMVINEPHEFFKFTFDWDCGRYSSFPKEKIEELGMKVTVERNGYVKEIVTLISGSEDPFTPEIVFQLAMYVSTLVK